MTLESAIVPLPPVGRALQINMHPFDWAHAVETLPHQIRVWHGQVERILLTVDTGQVGAGRYKGAGFDAASERVFALLKTIADTEPKVVVDVVDYGAQARALVTSTFFARTPDYPAKAFDGGPYHVYFYGIARANARHVLHMDSDMLFGGGSTAWFDESVALFAAEPDALFVAPFSGPPRATGDLDVARHVGMPGVNEVTPPVKLDRDVPTWRFSTVSTRIFLIDMARFAARVGALDVLKPDIKRRLRSRALNQQPISMPAEEVLSATLIRRCLARLDYLGTGAGMYSLHPPHRSPEFYRALPSLIARIEAGDVPEGQRGDFDINGSMFDWTTALATKTRPKRYAKALRHLMSANAERFARRRASTG